MCAVEVFFGGESGMELLDSLLLEEEAREEEDAGEEENFGSGLVTFPTG